MTHAKIFSVKVCDKSQIIKENKTEYVKREKSALHILNSSPGIISLACTFQDRSKLYFVLTFAANGELLKFIQRKGSLSLDCVKFYSGENCNDKHFVRFVTHLRFQLNSYLQSKRCIRRRLSTGKIRKIHRSICYAQRSIIHAFIEI